MRIVVTGREGQVVRALLGAGRIAGIEVVPLGRPNLDLAEPDETIASAIRLSRPDVLVSAAAYTQVDRAETEPELAFRVNEHGARAVARAARDLDVPLIHLSTDYVFDGAKPAPYVEDDEPHPTGVYGASKLAGEQAVMAEHADNVVLRTAWVYSPFGTNFARSMLRLARDREEIGVVADQRGTPTSAGDIAHAILAVARNLVAADLPHQRGLFHMAASGEATWAEFAEAVFAASAETGGPTAKVRHIATAEYPTPAKRPQNSRLDSRKLERAHGVRLGQWRSSINDVVRQLLKASA